MDWLRKYGGLVRKSSKKNRRASRKRSGSNKRRSSGKRKDSGKRRKISGRKGSGRKIKDGKRYYVTGKNRIVTAHKGERGYYYVKNTSNGRRKIGINGTTYSSEGGARKARSC